MTPSVDQSFPGSSLAWPKTARYCQASHIRIPVRIFLHCAAMVSHSCGHGPCFDCWHNGRTQPISVLSAESVQQGHGVTPRPLAFLAFWGTPYAPTTNLATRQPNSELWPSKLCQADELSITGLSFACSNSPTKYPETSLRSLRQSSATINIWLKSKWWSFPNWWVDLPQEKTLQKASTLAVQEQPEEATKKHFTSLHNSQHSRRSTSARAARGYSTPALQ